MANYWQVVKAFVISGNRLSWYNIAKVEKSRFAFPAAIQQEIKGETSMGWTAFVVKFKDGRYLSFGTTWYDDFFDMPESISS